MANQVSDWQLDCVELKQRGSHILQSGLWSDCTFSVGDQIVKAHRLILAMASPVFAVMLYGSMPNTDPILVEDVEPDTFKALLEYIYTDEVAVSSLDIAVDLSHAAKKYMLPRLVQECTTYMTSHLSPHNACRVYELAALLDDASLMEECMQVISENTVEVLNDSSFVKIEPTTLLRVLSLETMNIQSEMELVNAVTRYHKKRTESIPESTSSTTTRSGLDMRDQFTRDALGKIRFLTLTAQMLAEDPSVSSLLTAQEHHAVLMNITSIKSYIPMPYDFSISRQSRNSAIRNIKKSAVPSTGGMYCIREYTSNPGIEFHMPMFRVVFRVDRTVTLLGIQVPTQVMESSDGSKTYQEKIDIVFRQFYSNQFEIIPFRAHVLYHDLVDIKFPRPVTLEQDLIYSVTAEFLNCGDYPRVKCSSTATGREADTAEVNFNIIDGCTTGCDDLLRSFIIQKPKTGS